MIKTDNYTFGVGIGILFPVAFFGVIWLINYLLFQIEVAKYYMELQTHVLVGLAANMIPIRYYFVNLKFDKTGRGVLIVTFALILIFFGLKDYLIG